MDDYKIPAQTHWPRAFKGELDHTESLTFYYSGGIVGFGKMTTATRPLLLISAKGGYPPPYWDAR